MSAADLPPTTRRERRRREEEAQRSATTAAARSRLSLDGAFEPATDGTSEPAADGAFEPATDDASAPAATGASEPAATGALGITDPHPPATILFVCTGNICRSALAETLLRERLSGVDAVVRSAGTHALVGHGMPQEAQQLAARFGGDPAIAAAHKGRLLDERMLLDADLVLTMTAAHSTFTVQLEPARLRQVFPVRTFARLSSTLEDQEIHAIAQNAGAAPRTRLNAVVRAIGDRRGTVPARGDEEVSDPFRRGMVAYERSAAELLPALDEVARAARAALVATPG